MTVDLGSGDTLVVPKHWQARWERDEWPAEGSDSKLPRVTRTLYFVRSDDDPLQFSVTSYERRRYVQMAEALYRRIWDTERTLDLRSSLSHLTRTAETSSPAYVQWTQPEEGGLSYPSQVIVFVTAPDHAPISLSAVLGPNSGVVTDTSSDQAVVSDVLRYLELDL